jgi:hypothetical protein
MATHNEVALRVDPVSVRALQMISEGRFIISEDGEMLDVSHATDHDLVIWSLATQRLRTIARNIEHTVHAELADRVRRVGGTITTGYGTVTETLGRGSISGIAAMQIRQLLEAAAEDGLIPWEAVDNVAPLVAHVTPQKVWQYSETAPDVLREQLEPLIPEKRRTLKVAERPA